MTDTEKARIEALTVETLLSDDAIRDQCVARTAHGQCCACGGTVPLVAGTMRRYSFLQPPESWVPFAADEPDLRSLPVFHYPWCGGQGCADWLAAQELLGRLPHQSTSRPRARWVERPSWTLGVSGWGLQQGERLLAVAEPYLGAWRAFLRTGAGISPALPLARAQAWTEMAVVRAEHEPHARSGGQE